MFQDSGQETEIDLHKYVQLVMRRKWLVIGFTTALTIAVAIGTSLQPKTYEARTSVLAGNEAPRLLSFNDPFPEERFEGQAYLQTQGAILTSRTFLQEVVKRLMDEGFYGKIPPGKVKERTGELVKALKERVRVESSSSSRVMQIVVVGVVPERVVRLADAIADEYLKSNLQNREQIADQAVAWLDSQINDQKLKLDVAERAFQAFKEKERIASDANDPFASLGLARLQEDYLTTRFQRLEREARIEALKKADRSRPVQGESSSATRALDLEVQSTFREQLKKDYVATQLQLRDLSQRYGPEHPDIVTLQDKLSRIGKELQNLEAPAPTIAGGQPVMSQAKIEDLQSEYSFLLNKEKALSLALQSNQAEARKLSRTAAQYSLLKQEVDQSRQIYSDLMKRRDEARLSSQIRNSTVVILDRAELPKTPVKPKPLQNIILALVLGPVVSIGVVLLTEFLDRGVRTPQDALRYLRLPVLTVVPRATGKKRRKLPVGQEGERPTLITLQQPRSHPAECYRNLRTSILFSSGRPVPKTVLVTSAVAGEGKSTTAANLAVVMAQSGLKTVLVDADLRRPSLQRYFPRDPKRGLLRLLSDGIRVEEAVQESGVDNLSLLLCNSVPQTPSELLGSERAREVIDLLSSRYDVVVIDSPVVISVPDALILASRAAAVILVHRPGASNRDMVRHAREKLDEVKANVLGLVLNNVDIESGRYLYPEYAYYGYGHEKNGEASKGREKKP